LVALTASAMRGDRERFLAAGCDGYLSKPFKANELVEVVENYYDLKIEHSSGAANGHNGSHGIGFNVDVFVEASAVEAEPENVENIEGEIIDADPAMEVQQGDAAEILQEAVVEDMSTELAVDVQQDIDNAPVAGDEAEGEDPDLQVEEQFDSSVEDEIFEAGDDAEIVVDEVVIAIENDGLPETDDESKREEEGSEVDGVEGKPDSSGDFETVSGEMVAANLENGGIVDGDAEEDFVNQLVERLGLVDIAPPSPELDSVEADDPVEPLQNMGVKTVLVVEDNVYDARLFRRLFESKGYNVKVVDTGEEALRHLEDNQPTAILLDLVLPDMRGEDVLSMIRVNRFTAPIPVIVVSVKDIDPRARQALAEQADSVWSKESLDFRALLADVEKLMVEG
jgi:CheY-like chemotaxis protein